MRILTVRQPWAWAIIHGGKDVENRVRNVAGDYRGPVAIHAGMTDAADAPESLWLSAADFYRKRSGIPFSRFSWRDTNRGAIIGVVDLVDVHHWSTCLEGVFGCSQWAQSDACHLVFETPRALAEPIPYKGALGLRSLPDDVVAQVWAAVAS